VIGAEALVRWQYNGETVRAGGVHPGRGAEQPDRRHRRMGSWRGLSSDRGVGAEGRLPNVRISVNISARHFRKEGMAGDLMRIVSAHGVAPQRLCIEITEGVLMDFDRAQTNARRTGRPAA
jgi:EAL domain-containing protein (putative c-di-GMP-specific phosphodiesterase class I)